MHGLTLRSNTYVTHEDMTILDNLMLEQEEAHAARDLGNQTILIWLKMIASLEHYPPIALPQFKMVAPSRPTTTRTTTSTPIKVETTPHTLAYVVKNLRAIIESQQLAMLVNTYNVNFKQYSNRRKKKVTQFIPYALWKKAYAMSISKLISTTLCRMTL